jgi:hypothetical protein
MPERRRHYFHFAAVASHAFAIFSFRFRQRTAIIAFSLFRFLSPVFRYYGFLRH